MEMIRERIENIVTYHSDGGTSGYLLSNEQINELVELFQSQLRESLEEVIELSDKIESEGETTFEEWRAFKGFRNTLRERLGGKNEN